MNKEVCHITTVHPLFDTRIFHKECKTLVKAGYDVSLVAQHDKNENVDGVKIIALPKPKNRLERIFFLTKKAYKLALEQKADFYHFHDPEFLPWAIKLKKKTRAKVIYDVHENVPEDILSKYWIPGILRRPISEIFNFYEKRKAVNFDYLILAGDSIKEKFENINQNIKTINNFPVLQSFNRDINRKEKNPNFFNLIYIGGLTEVRGITQVVQAMEFLPDNIRLMLLGTFSPKSYEKVIKNLEGFKKTKYYGQVPYNEVFEYLTRADIGIICLLPIPSHIRAGFGSNKLFEYMSAGLPVIASDLPQFKTIIEGNNCGICVNPLEPKEIAKAVEYLIENPEKAKKIGENGKKAVMEKYNWENESKKLLEVYQSLSR